MREAQLEQALLELHAHHCEKRRVLTQELVETALIRKAIQDEVWANWISSSLPSQQLKLLAELPTADRCLVEHGKEEEAAASNLKYQEQEDGDSSTAGAALKGKGGPGEGDIEVSYCAESSLKARQQRDKEKQALLKELLPEKSEVRVELQRLLEVQDEKALRKVYEHRMKIEDPREIRAHRQTLAARRAGLWRFVSKKKVEAERERIEREETAEDEISYVDNNRLGPPRFPDCYEEIKNLLDIEKDPIFSKTLQEWNQKRQSFTLALERYQNQVASVKNEVYQLIGFFSVFQGVVLTAVSQSNFFFCHNKWSPITLSVLASAISIFGVIQKWSQIGSLRMAINHVNLLIKTTEQVGKLLQVSVPKGIDFVQLHVEIERNLYRTLRRRNCGLLYFLVAILFLVAFGVLFPISFWRILCKPGAPPPAQ